jgi:adenylate cyclase
MGETGAQRKLAAIVAIDVAGYSARTLADQAASVAEIGTLRGRIAGVCESHGGRLFNSAGDGFMLEFPTASGALDAAEALAAGASSPIRIGVHLGEVHVTPTGDLLGHGVNVAARIQALASPGSVLVSADIRHAARGHGARRFIAHGAVRLAKMDETVKVFGLGKADAASRVRLSWRRSKASVAAAVLVVGIAGAAVWFWRGHTQAGVAAEGRVAVLPFEVQSDDPLTKSVANSVADEVSTVLSGAQFVTIAPDQTARLRGQDAPAAAAQLGAAFLMHGSVTHEGHVLRIHVRLDDTRAGVTIWSDEASAPDTEAGALEADVASRATSIAILARAARRSPGGDVEPGVLAAYLRADDAMDSVGLRGSVGARPALQQVVDQAPGFSRGHSALALADALISRWDAPDRRDILVRSAQAEAAKAQALDPHSGEPYLALYQLVPLPQWVERERIMLQGLSVEPDYQRMVSTRSNFLADVGRVADAIPISQRAVTANPLEPHAVFRYASVLAEAGQFAAARAQADQMVRVRPAEWTDLGRLSLVMLYGSVQDAKTLLNQSLAHPYPGEAPALNAWSAFLQARETQDAGDRTRAVAAVKAAAQQGSFAIRDAIPVLCVLGDLDAAFADFALLGRSVENAHVDFLWTPAAAPLQRDARFWAFAARHGMIQYWRTTGHWPDLCRSPDELADCKAKAAAAHA